MSFVTHLLCARCGKEYEAGKIYNLCVCGGPLEVQYDFRRAGAALTFDRLAARPPTLWRYREVLPVERESSIVCLGEGFTPLLHAARLGEKLGAPNLYLKDEAQNPTGSFKARGMSVAISMARELGVGKVAVPSAGNAGGAMAAYAAACGMKAWVVMPEETPYINRVECLLHGAETQFVSGSIKDCGRVARERAEREGWFDVSTLREPYRVEGKKTMAYELFEQLGRRVPHTIFYPTGGGTGLIGMWKAIAEMEAMGWTNGKRPKMVAVQAAGCAPIVRAFAAKVERAEEWHNPQTLASGLRVPSALGDFLMLKALRESHGAAVAVEDGAMLDAMREIAATEGLVTSPEGGATLAALEQLLRDGLIQGQETIVLFLTASGYKYVETLRKFALR